MRPFLVFSTPSVRGSYLESSVLFQYQVRLFSPFRTVYHIFTYPLSVQLYLYYKLESFEWVL